MSQRGVLNLCHSDPQRDAFARRGNAMRRTRRAELLDAAEVRRMCPYPELRRCTLPPAAYCNAAAAQPADAVAWGFARGVDKRGVDPIQNCEVTGIASRTVPSKVWTRRADS